MASACSTASRRTEMPMKNILLWISIVALSVSTRAVAQDRRMPTSDRIPSSLMTFFVTSEPIGAGGNLGGLAGADAHCQALAAAVGAGGKTWRAYLSTQARPGEPAVNARDRIGTGPWHNSKKLPIAADLAELNGDTIELARLGSNLFKQSALDEKGALINGAGDTPNMHDMLTGSQTD